MGLATVVVDIGQIPDFGNHWLFLYLYFTPIIEERHLSVAKINEF